MPEYQTVETFVKCNAATLSSVLDRYRSVLKHLDCLSPAVEDWLSQVAWPSIETGYRTDYPSIALAAGNEIFPARIYLSFPIANDGKRWSDWVELGLLLESESLRSNDIEGLYFEPAGRLLWHLLEMFALAFPEYGAYCTDELQCSDIGYVVVEARGNTWFAPGFQPAYPLVDAALVPVEIANRFEPIPAVYEHLTWKGFVGLAVRDRFLRLPWVVP